MLDYAADDALGMSLLVAIYSLAAHVKRPRSAIHGGAIVGVAVLVVVVGVIVPQGEPSLVCDTDEWCPVRHRVDPRRQPEHPTGLPA